MNCATMTPDESSNCYRDHNNRDSAGGSERRTSRRLTCLRGESDEHYDYEAEGKDFFSVKDSDDFYRATFLLIYFRF